MPRFPRNRMENMPDPATDIASLLEHCRTLILATLDVNGNPQASPAPFIHDRDNRFHVLVSTMAPHTAHMIALKPTGVMLIEDENDALHIFARRRLNYVCNVSEVFRDQYNYDELIEKFKDRFGSFASALANLPDFHMFSLYPASGRLVVGFGRAYRIKDDIITSIGPEDVAPKS